MLHDTGYEFVATETGFENTDLALLKERCDFWKSVGGKIPV
jgi:hypothetical protein